MITIFDTFQDLKNLLLWLDTVDSSWALIQKSVLQFKLSIEMNIGINLPSGKL